MRNTSNAISPFYDQEPGAPPPFPPMLTDQLELFCKIHRPTTLIADEILAPKASSIITTVGTSPTCAPKLKLTKRSHKRGHRSSPYSKEVARTCSRSMTPISSDSPGSSNSSSNGDSSTPVVPLPEDLKIPKPPGEPGRPGRGGYTLYEALNWSPKAYAKFKKHVHNLIDDHLETAKCSSAQSPALLKVVRNKAVSEFPELEKYINLWPVNDMIMSRLKYTSGRARRKLVEMAVGKSKSDHLRKTNLRHAL
ncbi:uncharacterized protein F5891DRAFT_1194422 [Suillus fuscotomentosus]|uniref:Uncharacterized protein n=1 Tax=Suillus fuscotomentosus TaxID=1912939 RepID=A0AAD4HH21_9AGAM|nr:uncharacterized protein F5891DRAFT_1194422 [Suillus fuscotomentosus]KAG1847810.1 hypothetical protein C8R48DRAFT_779148 [Suillus tomentosus]KAG1895214.1 hypothetical protein F5891DRAFT_1194422 [Suillus fuscotomentosus]